MAAAVGAGTLLVGCGPHSLRQATCVDPTDACNWSVVVVRNDTPRAVELRACVHHCGDGDHRLDPLPVSAGGTSSNKQYGSVYALTNSLNWWVVEDTAGGTLGCLVLDGHPDKRDGDVVLVSEARPCGSRQPATRVVGRSAVQGA